MGLAWLGRTLAPVTSQEPCHNGGSYQPKQQVTLLQYSLGERRVRTQTGGCAERGTRATAEPRVPGEPLLSGHPEADPLWDCLWQGTVLLLLGQRHSLAACQLPGPLLPAFT